MKTLTNAQVRTALQEAIAIWTRRAAGHLVAPFYPLCVLGTKFNSNCGPCPVAAYVGDVKCRSTPYWSWHVHPYSSTARKELAFLKEVKRHYFGPGSALRVRNQLNLGGCGRDNK